MSQKCIQIWDTAHLLSSPANAERLRAAIAELNRENCSCRVKSDPDGSPILKFVR